MFMIDCPACNESLKLPDEVAGKPIRCWKCMSVIWVPIQPVDELVSSSGTTSTDLFDEM